MIIIIYILIFLILVFVAIIGFKAASIGIEAKQRNKLNRGIQDTIESDNAEAIILGCAGMADLAKNLEIKHKLPVIEGVSSAVVLAESLVKLKIKTSKVGSYALPRNKSYMGYLNKFKP